MTFIKRFLGFLVLLLVVLAAAIWWLPAPVIKWVIENPGSEAVGAQIDVDRVSFSWFPARVELQGLAITNPRAPMTNAVEFHTIATELNVMEAIGGKIHIEDVLIEGVALDTPRATSGALPGRPAAEEESSSFAMPDLGLPDPSALVEKEKALYQQKIDAFNQELAERQRRWQSVLDGLPDDSKLAEYDAQWKDAKSGNVLEKVSKAKKVAKAIQQDIKALEQGKDQIQGEYAQLQQDYRNLSRLSDQSLDRIIQDLGLSDSVIANLGNQLLSGTVQQWLKTGQGYYNLLLGGESSNGEDSATEPADTAADAPQTSPDFLVKRVRLTGPFVHAAREGSIEGEILNLSDAPALWPEPVSIDVKAQGESLGLIQLDGLLAHQKAGAEQDTLALVVKNSRLQSWALSESEALGMMVNNALVNFNAKASVKAGNELDMNLQGVFSELEMALAQSGSDGWQQTLAQSLAALKTLTLNGEAKGPLDDPELAVSTNLNGVLKNALSAELKQRAQALKADVKGTLDTALAEQTAPLKSQVDGLGGMGGEADARIKEFEAMLKQIR